jgi:UDP-GlcNAc:undecaprenyl-phosphate GlcNAc-1-phosphate transferase
MESGNNLGALLGALPLAAAAASLALWVLTPPIIRLCRRLGLFDYPGARKRHLVPTPRLGGLAIAMGLAISLSLTYLLWPRLFLDLASQWPGIIWAGLLILALGIYDDVVGAPAYLKLMAQITAALLLCLWDFKFATVWVPFVGRIELGIWSIPLTTAWIVVLCNAVNLVDGLDGLASGLAAIGGCFMAGVGILWSVPHVAVLGAALVGANLGFLRFNYPPARIFMGDSGSLFLGFAFAVASVSVPIKTLTAITMALPLLAVWFPVVEVVTSATRRLLSGRSPMRADHAHWHQLLMRRGWSVKRIIWTYYALAVGFGLFVPALRFFDRYLVLPIFLLFCAAVIGYLTLRTRPKSRPWETETADTSVEHARV